MHGTNNLLIYIFSTDGANKICTKKYVNGTPFYSTFCTSTTIHNGNDCIYIIHTNLSVCLKHVLFLKAG